MRQQFKETALRLAEKDDRLVLVFGDISVFLFNDFSRRYPERLLNIGICENTLISMAAAIFLPYFPMTADFFGFQPPAFQDLLLI